MRVAYCAGCEQAFAAGALPSTVRVGDKEAPYIHRHTVLDKDRHAVVDGSGASIVHEMEIREIQGAQGLRRLGEKPEAYLARLTEAVKAAD